MRNKSVIRTLKKDRSVILVLALTVLIVGAACSKNVNNANSVNSSNTSGSNKTSSSTTTNSTSTSTSSASMSPTEVFKAYYDAGVKKDFDAAKKYLSQSTLQMLEERAKKQGMTLDEAMKNSPAASPNDMPQASNEQINGDTATVDLSAQGQKITMPFVKEGGEWKLAIDKFMENMGISKQPDGDAGAGHDNH